jgi:hypothetical protein
MGIGGGIGPAKRRRSRPQAPSNPHRKPAANRSRITAPVRAKIGGLIPAAKPHGSPPKTAGETGRDRKPISNGIGGPKATRIGGASALGIGNESAGLKRETARAAPHIGAAQR